MKRLAAICCALPLLLCSCLGGVVPKEMRTAENLSRDLGDYSSSSHLRRFAYERYADRASLEGDRAAAGLFSALARSEQVHETSCRRAAELFDVKCDRTSAIPVPVGTTGENLLASIAVERERLGNPRGVAVKRAVDCGNYYVARTFIWIDATNRRHIELLEHRLATHPNDSLPCSHYRVCPGCGNIYEGENYDAWCPLCRTHHGSFESYGLLAGE